MNAVVGTILMIAIAVAIAGVVYFITQEYFANSWHIEEPQRWIDTNQTYGTYDIKNREYIIHIINISGLSLDKTAGTGSMSPTIPKGAIILIKIVKNEALKKGDIIVFNVNNNTRIVHRIVSVGKDDNGIFYKTKGDAADMSDPWKVRPNQIVGVVVGVIW